MSIQMWQCASTLALACLLALAGCAGSKPKPPPPWGVFPPVPQAPQPHLSQQLGITVQGEVRHPLIPWTPDLTLARALLQAEYVGARDPQSIVVFRGDKAILVETRQLLGGVKDPPLLPGDIIELRR